MSDVATIAFKLTDPQRTALWNLSFGKPEFENGWRRAPHDGWRRAGQACSNLVGKGLAEKEVEDFAIMYRASPLGKQVAEYIRQSLTKGENA